MKKILGIILAVAMLATSFAALSITGFATPTVGANLLVDAESTFEDATVPAGWSTTIAGAVGTISTAQAHSGTQSLLQSGRTFAYEAPIYDIYSLISASGPGVYTISAWVYADGMAATANGSLTLRCNAAGSFSPGAAQAIIGNASIADKTWTKISGFVTITQTDIDTTLTSMKLCTDGIVAPLLYLDDVVVSYCAASDIAAIGTYGYNYTIGTGSWYNLTELGTDVLSGGVASVVVKNTSATELSFSLDCRIAVDWSGIINSPVVIIPAGAIRTVYMEGLPADHTMLLLQVTGVTGSATFTIGNITKFTKASTLASSNGAIPTTSVELTTLDAADDYTVKPDRSACDFEGTTTQGWASYLASTVALSTEAFHGGAQSLKVTGRTETYHSPGLDISGTILAPGMYKITAYVKWIAGTEGALRMVVRNPNASDANSPNIMASSAPLSASTDWEKIELIYDFTAADLAYTKLCFDTTACSFYLDDVTIESYVAPVVDPFVFDGTCDFEDGTVQGWSPFAGLGAATFVASDEAAHSGTYSLKVTGRANEWSSPSLDFSNVITAPGAYTITAFVKKLAAGTGAGGDQVRMMLRNADLSLYSSETQGAVCLIDLADETDWVEYSFTYTFTQADIDGGLTLLCFDSSNASIYIDDVSVAVASDEPVPTATPIPGEHTADASALAYAVAAISGLGALVVGKKRSAK